MRYCFYRFLRSCGAMFGLLVLLETGWSAENAALVAALNSITADELQQHVNVLADDTFEGRAAGSRGGHAAANYLASYFKEQGLDAGGERASYFQGFNGSCRNILGILPGSDPDHRHEFILVSAHYDHVGYGNARNSFGPTGYIHNGADDNASGVAAVLEIIQAFNVMSERPRRSILFALWDGEEDGLLGSKHWAAVPTVELKDVEFALNMDMVGRLRETGVEVYGVRSGSGLRKLVSLANRNSQLPLQFLWEMKANSDHYSMFERNVPVLMLHTGLHEDYHRPSDDADKINAEGIRSVASLAFQICWDVAESETRPVFRRASFNESPGAQHDFEGRVAPPPKRLGISWRPEETGHAILQVTSGSAAARAGLKVGDVLVEFNGRPIENDGRFSARLLAATNPITLGVRRAGKEELETISVNLDGEAMRVGLRWRPDPADATAFYITQVVPGSPAELAGIKPGDWLYTINGLAFTSSDELAVWLKSATGELEITTERRGRVIPVHVKIDEIEPAVSE